VDLTQAFDRIQLRDVLNILYENWVDMKITKLLIKEMNVTIRTDCGVTRDILVALGIRQGII